MADMLANLAKERLWEPYRGLEKKMENLKGKMEWLGSRKVDIVATIQDAEFHSFKKRKTEVQTWLSNVNNKQEEFQILEKEVQECGRFDRIKLANFADTMIEEAEELIKQGKFPEGVLHNVYEEKGEPLVTTNLKGQVFGRSSENISEMLRKDEVSSIGIYGMGGVGKTTMAMHINNELLQESRFSGHVYWVTVSQDSSIQKLQNGIAENIGLDLSCVCDEIKRAAKLFQALKRIDTFVLILDDVWNNFDVIKVGIPLANDGGKMIITSRSLEVCRRVGCQKYVKVKPLSEVESWDLFTEKLGRGNNNEVQVIPTDIEKIAMKVAERCAGLPLGIITMAGCMKGVNDIFEWKDVLQELEESSMMQDDMKSEVFPILHCSYTRLRDPRLQKCFLYCCLYPEDFEIPRVELVNKFIMEGFINARKSRQAQIDQGHAILNKLENVCLLESTVDVDENKCVKMHDLIREMAIKITSHPHHDRFMVKARMQLIELPELHEWSEDLDKVSLMHNSISQISPCILYKCLKLTTLLMQENRLLQTIPCSFFMFKPCLRVLDLSYTNIEELPGSLSNLGNLNALLLKGCRELSFVPSLSNLKVLSELELSGTGIEQVPVGIPNLVKLKCLTMSGLKKLKGEPPIDMFASLSHLQRLMTPFSIRAMDLERMKQLEEFGGKMFSLCDFNKFVANREYYGRPILFRVTLNGLTSDCVGDLYEYPVIFSSKEVILKDYYLKGGNVVQPLREQSEAVINLPRDMQRLEVSWCDFISSDNSFLSALPSLINLTDLKIVKIVSCDGIECILQLPSNWQELIEPEGIESLLKSLENLELYNLKDIVSLIDIQPNTEASFTVLSHGSFSNLKKLRIEHCCQIKVMFPRWLWQNLYNLEHVAVSHCEGIEEIISENEEEEEGQEASSQSLSSPSSSFTSTDIILPKLRVVQLTDLPALKSISKGRMTCVSLEEIGLCGCPKLQRLPFFHPPHAGEPLFIPHALRYIYVSLELWQSLEWDYPEAKSELLQHIRPDRLLQTCATS
ncbi:probable disease resistance protein At4g27220 [Solanum dulcamara]|uniref:probable disease resistance protein At4g27220 n=1 Tax=Solanum dulcamara TaxID=45834 RepID=UPI002486517A|nr:probable disease resistance protein At4g27220 [Solanum dulcamara]XP_055805096.1 probable disease resistance protein At4g27220 [Solanum dulcamara]XP_055805097.1 probable disease resistance protein At4g27220 [Solanum dulcamara]